MKRSTQCYTIKEMPSHGYPSGRTVWLSRPIPSKSGTEALICHALVLRQQLSDAKKSAKPTGN